MHIEEVEAIWAAIDEADDWAPLHAKIAADPPDGRGARRRKCLKNPAAAGM